MTPKSSISKDLRGPGVFEKARVKLCDVKCKKALGSDLGPKRVPQKVRAYDE